MLIRPGSRTSPRIDVFCDASYSNDLVTGRSISGVFVFIDGSLVDWSSKHQPYVTLSSGDAEIVATCSAATHAEYWIQLVGLVFNMNPLDVECAIGTDSTTARNLLTNPVHTTVMKHIRIRQLFIRERVNAGMFTIYHLPGTDNPADMLTKPLSGATIRHLKRIMRSIHDSISLGVQSQSFTSGLSNTLSLRSCRE